MSDESAKPAGSKKCAAIPPHPNLMPMWGCCMCRVANGTQRKECKNCGHPRCDVAPENQPS